MTAHGRRGTVLLPEAQADAGTATQPRPARLDAHKAGRRRDCELRDHGAPYGWETQTLENGELSTGRHFETYALALQWAELEREALERDGWRGR
jgi:hypothetical protein